MENLNGCENYSICSDRTDSAVVLPFNQVYNEIRKQIKHNITSNTHVFEYCIIPSDEHLIENLSQLRVRPKSWTSSDNTSLNVCINSDMNSGSVPAPEPQSPTPPLLSQWKPLIPIPLPVSTPILSPLAPGTHPSAPINYLDVELNSDTFATTGSCPHMPYITFTARVGTVWVTAMKFVDDEKWAVIRLVQCLANCPNRETAATVNPLFNTMHSFVPYFLMTAKEYTKLNELKRLFAAKCCEWLTTTDPTIGTDNGSASDGTDIAPVVPETLVTTLTTGSALPALSDTFWVSSTPPMSADPGPKHLVDINELDELLSISATITMAHIFEFTHLCHSVGQAVKIVGALTADNEDWFWSHVSHLMLDSGYGSLNQSIYRLLFTHHVTKYYVI
ncbi:unnamed protein product, partial [Medioppia subpectinata]